MRVSRTLCGSFVIGAYGIYLRICLYLRFQTLLKLSSPREFRYWIYLRICLYLRFGTLLKLFLQLNAQISETIFSKGFQDVRHEKEEINTWDGYVSIFQCSQYLSGFWFDHHHPHHCHHCHHHNHHNHHQT